FALFVFLMTLFLQDAVQAQSKAKPPVQPKKSYTLEQAVNQAMETNPSIESKLRMLENARMNVGVAQSYFWPRVSLVATTNHLKNYEEVETYNSDNLSSDNWSKGVRAQLNLFVGFAHLNNFQKSRLNVEVEAARHKQARLELACNVQLQFLQLLRLRQELKTAQDSVGRLKTQLKSAESYVAVGMAPYVNVLQNQTELAKAEQQVIRLKNDLRNTQVQLNKYLGFSPESMIQYVGDLKKYPGTVGYTEQNAVKTAVRKRPDLIIAQKSVEMAWKDMHITMGRFLPRVDATYDNMSSSREYDDELHYQGYTRNYWSAGLTFSWDVFSGGESTFQTLADRKRAQSLQKDFEDAMNNAQAEVIRALLDITAAKELITASAEGIKAARESYEMASTRYATHTGTITELLDAQVRLTQAEDDVSRAYADFQSARARFFYYIGRENFGLK
ncbi:MAG: TolC family protein, partial [Desulfovibrio sp.]|nr:TolC family protein [Desulfovibrio sp.]